MRDNNDIIVENYDTLLAAYKDCAEVLVLIYNGIKDGKMLNPVIKVKDDVGEGFKSISLAHLIAGKLQALEKVLKGEGQNENHQ